MMLLIGVIVIGAWSLLVVLSVGSVAFGVALAASGMVFTAVAAVAHAAVAKVPGHRAVAFAVLGTAFAPRAIGDAGSVRCPELPLG